MGEILADTDDIRLSVIKGAWERGMRYAQITPDMQIAQWLAIGLKRLEENQILTSESLGKIDKM